MVGPLKSVYQHALVRFRLGPDKGQPQVHTGMDESEGIKQRRQGGPVLLSTI